MNNGFFAISDDYEQVDVGGNGDCGFRSVVAGLIDQLSQKRSVTYKLNIERLLTEHLRYFPKHRAMVAHISEPILQMRHLMQTISMAELIRLMAYTVRQIAVDEMQAHPSYYRGAFINDTEGTSPAYMRRTGTWIDETSIAALSNALSLPIEVKYIDYRNNLPLSRVYNNSEDEVINPIIIQLHKGHYTPFVMQPDLFTTAKNIPQKSVFELDAVNTKRTTSDLTMEEILALIAKDDAEILELFDYTKKILNIMLVAKELSVDDLIDIYIQGMPKSDYLVGRIKYAGLEHGNQHFFEEILHQAKLHALTESMNYDDYVIDELVHAISRAVSIGQVKLQDISNYLDDKENHVLASIYY